MATDTHIEIGTATRLSQKLRNDIDQLARLRAELAGLKAVMDASVVGATVAADYAPIEGAFNIQGGAQAGANGQAVYNLVAGALQRLNNTAIDAMLAQLG